MHVEGDAAHGLHAAEGLFDVADLEQRRHERAFLASRRAARPTMPPGKKAIMTITSTA